MPDSPPSTKFHLIAALTLLALNIACFHPALNCYFLGDDLFHIQYLHRILNEAPLSLLDNFRTVWCQDLGYGAHYRPLTSFSFALDYLLFHSQAAGYHLTNLLWHYAVCLAVYFLAGALWRLSERSSEDRVAGLATAVLFTLTPTNCEPAAWMSARVDSICAFFYVTSLYFLLRDLESPSSFKRAGGLVLFALALLSKEAAASLPVVFSACVVAKEKSGFRRTIRSIFEKAGDVWLLFLAYLGLRALVIGELFGGYKGGIGALLSASFAPRVVSAIELLAYPVPLRQLIDSDIVHTLQQALYATVSVLTVLAGSLCATGRASIEAREARRLILALTVLSVSVLPILPVIYLSEAMQGGRLFYLPAIFAAFTATSGLACLRCAFPSGLGKYLYQGFLVCFCFLIALNGLACLESSFNFRKASQEIIGVQSSALETAERESSAKRLVVLSIPAREGLPRLFFNSKQFFALIKPPLTEIDYSSKFALLEPDLSTDMKAINRTCLEHLARDSGNRFFLWNEKNRCFERVPAPHAERARIPANLLVEPLDPASHFQWRLSPAQQLSPASFDILIIRVDTPPGSAPERSACQLFYQEAPRDTLTDGKSFKKSFLSSTSPLTFLPAQRPDWLLAPRCSAFYLNIFPESERAIVEAQLESAAESMPVLWVDETTMILDRNGIFEPARSGHGVITWDCTRLDGASSCRVDISIPHAVLQLPSLSFLTEEPGAQVMKTITVERPTGRLTLERQWFPLEAPYQIRVRALSETGAPLGFYSYPINYMPR
ncbi:MAG: glycosyltransferase family 39 protein [Cyanobacteria bacterium HKST-UBA02]|nr:glycosyltransferase family 39 protein [Cyanobacteria bacterium HKST-UBA02]